MSDTINDKLNALKSRVETLTGINIVVKRKRQFNENELPACAIYRTQSQVESSPDGRQYSIGLPLIVEYFKAQSTDDPAAEAEAMIDAVIAVVEVDDIYNCQPINFSADNLTLPEDDEGVIAVQVAFETEIIRTYGGA